MPATPKAAAGASLWRDILGLSKLWPYLRPNRRLMIAAALLIPVISLLQMSLPLIIRHAIDAGITAKNQQVIITSSLIFMALTLAEYIARTTQSLSAAVAVHRMILLLRRRLMEHILRLSCSFHDRTLSGTLVTRATSDFDNLSESLNQGVLTSVIDMAVLIGSLAGLFVLDWRLALTTFAILPLVGKIVSAFSNALKRAMLAARVKIAALNAYTQECLYGASTVKVLTAQSAAARRYDALNIDYRDTQMRSVVLDAFMFATIDGIATITIGIILWVAIKGVTGEELLTVGVMVAFVQYVQQLFEPLKQLGNKIAMLQGAFTAIDRVFGVLAETEIMPGREQPEHLAGAVQFQDVSFRYTGAGERPWVLQKVSFTVPAGTTMAIVGATGSGKSTIVKLLTKLYTGYEGAVAIDGHEVTDIDGDYLRQRFAIVPQDIVIFEGSVAFNISLGQDGITREQVAAAAKTVGAHGFIQRLPGGYDFVLQEQGANLSHGQRQLIAFARAMVRNPVVVILDEATSSVDSESEAMIQEGVRKILRDRTVIVIAHRLSTIRQCHQILVLERGQVVELGDHRSLMAKNGAYARLHHALATEQTGSHQG